MFAPSSTETWPARVAPFAMMTWSPSVQSCAMCACAMMRQSSPVRVRRPPPSVPRWTVTNSRMRLRRPMRVSAGSPRYFKSCGSSPIDAKGKTCVSSPTSVRPSTTTWDSRRTRAPRRTSSPTVQNGPTCAPSPTSARGLTADVGWTKTGIRRQKAVSGFRRSVGSTRSDRTMKTGNCPSLHPAPVGDDAHDVGLGGELTVDVRLAVHLLDAVADADGRHGDDERVAGDDGAAEAPVVDAAEEDELVVARLQLLKRVDGPDLRHRLQDEDAGHDGRAGEVALEEVLVDRHLLDPDDAHPLRQLDDAVNEQERVAVRQNLLDGAGVEKGVHGETLTVNRDNEKP